MTRLFPKRPRKDGPTARSASTVAPLGDTASATTPAKRTASRKRRQRPRALIALTLVLVAALCAALSLANMQGTRLTLAARDGPALASVIRWGYQLQGVKARLVPDAVDLLVIDYSRDGTDAGRFSSADVERFKMRSDGRRRIVLAYLSIGEAERYRYYWQGIWRFSPPRWLGQENREWRGNFAVKYWDREWQRLLIEQEPSRLAVLLERWLGWNIPYVDQILQAGFDGLYLDRVDGFADWPTRASAKEDMAALIGRISRHAKARRPGTLIVQQNGEELLRRRDVLATIDGVAKEDLVFGATSEGAPNPPGDVASAVADLMRAKRDGKSVFVVEYVEAQGMRAQARARVSPLGFPLLFAARALNEPPVVDDAVRAAPSAVPAPDPKAPPGRKRQR